MKTNKNLHYNPYLNLKTIGRKLRKEMTETEIRLWSRVRKKQINNLQFFRQRPIGNFVVDFYCPQKKLVIEIDGGQHYWNENISNDDKERDIYLSDILGIKVLRFTNVDIFQNIEDVVHKIIEATK